MSFYNRMASPGDVQLNLLDDAPVDMNTSDKRKQNSERRSQVALTSSVHEGENSDDDTVDIKKMKVNFDEHKDIMVIVKQIEKDFYAEKSDINKFDTMAIEANCLIQTMKQSYKILKENLYKSNPNFDQSKIEANVHQLLLAVTGDIE